MWSGGHMGLLGVLDKVLAIEFYGAQINVDCNKCT